MAGATLGKRQRLADRSEDSTNFTRSKRRALQRLENDENADPLAPQNGDYSIEDQDSMDVDGGSPTKRAKHTPNTTGARSPLSPRKINVHPKATKAIVATTSSTIREIPSTPQTNRHRDALSKTNPVTPRHRVAVPGKPITPRQTPSTPSGKPKSVYNLARTVFTRNADLGSLVGRESQRNELEAFVNDNIKTNSGGCIYVSGPPGTGKTALVSEICKAAQAEPTVKFGFINCMSVKSAVDIYTLLATELGITDDMFEGNLQDQLRCSFVGGESQTSFLVVLDEIDQLVKLDLNILYNLFEWSMSESTKLILVGISNALDLTDRFLPRLKARSLKPKLLPFLPYTAAEIKSIVTSRCRSLLPTASSVPSDFTPFLHPSAIQLISKKVSSQSGDIRKAFDIAQRAVDLVEADTRLKLTQQNGPLQAIPVRTPLAENPNLSSPSSGSPASPKKLNGQQGGNSVTIGQYTAETAPRAMLSHIVKITSAAFGNGTSQRLKGLNLQQKAILCSLVALERKTKKDAISHSTPSKRKHITAFMTPTKSQGAVAAAPTLKVLYDTYSALCKRENLLHGLSNTEFRDVVGNLENSSLVVPVDGRKGSFVMPSPITPSKKGRGSGFSTTCVEDNQISACVSMEELEAAVDGVGAGILKSMLYGEIDV